MTDAHDFFTFLDGVLQALALDVPSAHAAARDGLGRLPVEITVDGKRRQLVMTERGHTIRPTTSAEAPLRLSTSRGAIVDLLEAHTCLVDSVREDSFAFQGRVEDLVRLEETLFAIVRGAARSRNIGKLLAAYLNDSGKRTPTNHEVGHPKKRMEAWDQ